LDCPIHEEPLFDNLYNKKIGYCKRCRTWYEFEELERKKE